MKNYVIAETARQAKEAVLFGAIPIVQMDGSTETSQKILLLKSSIEKHPLKKFFANIDAVYVGNFPEFSEKGVVSLFSDAVIYLSSARASEEMFKDVLHELAHAFLENNGGSLANDEEMRQEFLSKRIELYDTLRQNKDRVQKLLPKKHFANTAYSSIFDKYLVAIVGYDLLDVLTRELFLSPYAATSLEEYFANGFQEYFSKRLPHKDKVEISPILMDRIEEIIYDGTD